MTDTLLVFCTCPNHTEASQLARSLVEAGVAACVNIVSAIESVYRWQGAIETASEVLLLIKTNRERFPALQELLVQLHSYDTPEILAVPVAGGLTKYLAWIDEAVAK